MVMSAERWSARCRVGGRVSEQPGEGRLLGGCGDRQTMWGFEDAVTCDSLPDMGALGSGFWAGVSDCHALVTPMSGNEDRRYLLWLHNGGEGPQKRRVESWPLSSTHIYHIFHQNLSETLQSEENQCSLRPRRVSKVHLLLIFCLYPPAVDTPLDMPPPWPHGSLLPFSSHSESPCIQNHIPPPPLGLPPPPPAIHFFPKLSPQESKQFVVCPSPPRR